MMKRIGIFLLTVLVLSLFTGFATAACPLATKATTCNTCSTCPAKDNTSVCPAKTFCSGVSCSSCVPDFTAGFSGKKVSFKDKSSGTPAAYYWNFGDGYVSRVQNPVHTYKKAGTYRVCLSVKCGGKWIAKCKSVKV